MVETLVQIIRSIAVHAVAVMGVGVLFFSGIFSIIYWGFARKIAWFECLKWVVLATALLCGGIIIYSVLPQSWSITIGFLVVPHALCACVLHSFFKAFERYSVKRYAVHVNHAMIKAVIISMYLVNILAIIVVWKTDSAFVTYLIALWVDYTIKIGVIGIVVLDYLQELVPSNK